MTGWLMKSSFVYTIDTRYVVCFICACTLYDMRQVEKKSMISGSVAGRPKCASAQGHYRLSAPSDRAQLPMTKA